jgi:hypothetical protein
MVEAARRNGRIVQAGSRSRSMGRMRIRPEEVTITQNTGNQSHTQNFLECVRTRRTPKGYSPKLRR